MMVDAYSNDIDDARSQRHILPPLPSFSHLCAGFYPHRGGIHPFPEASGPSVVSYADLTHPLQQTPKVLCRARDTGGC